MEQSKDNRKNNGGFRHGAGRKAGSGVPSENKTIRIPLEVLAEVEKRGIKGTLTKIILTGLKKELKKMPIVKLPDADGKV